MELIKHAKMRTQIFHGMEWNIWNKTAMQKTGFYIFQLEWNGMEWNGIKKHEPVPVP